MWYVVPKSDPSDKYAAGYDGNEFASEEEAKKAAKELEKIPGFEIDWIVVEDED